MKQNLFIICIDHDHFKIQARSYVNVDVQKCLLSYLVCTLYHADELDKYVSFRENLAYIIISYQKSCWILSIECIKDMSKTLITCSYKAFFTPPSLSSPPSPSFSSSSGCSSSSTTSSLSLSSSFSSSSSSSSSSTSRSSSSSSFGRPWTLPRLVQKHFTD